MYCGIQFTPRERQILAFVIEGMNNSQIAAATGMSLGTVKNYMVMIYDKTGHSNRVELALWAIKYGHEGT